MSVFRYKQIAKFICKGDFLLMRYSCIFVLIINLLHGIDSVCALEKTSNIAYKQTILEVGPDKRFLFPSVASEFANDGDVIEIDANGYYDDDIAIWKASNLTIRGVNGRPHIKSHTIIKNGKAVWVLLGDNLTIENIEFSGAKVSDHNGAALRLEGSNLNIKNCHFHNNENSLLTGENHRSEINIQDSVFAYNGYGKGKTHNLYVGRIKKLTFTGNLSHHANVGHALKTRALENNILYNQFMDGADGRASYLIDFPNGGYSIVMGNVIQQSPNAENRTMLAYGLEGLKNKSKELYIAYNTFVNNRSSGVFVKAADSALGKIENNIFSGKGSILAGEHLYVSNNFKSNDMDLFANPESFNYKAAKVNSVVDRAIPFITLENRTIIPKFQIAQSGLIKRERAGSAFDLGAFEFSGN